jgi:tetrahydromethanopterin:alpha-L-glutamate ligase
VLVVGRRAVTAMRRVSTGWIHNVAQGARCEPAELTPALAALAESAAAALDMDYAGIDMIPCASGIQVLEVNGVAAWRGLQRVTAFNIARAIVDDLLDRKLAVSRAGLRA